MDKNKYIGNEIWNEATSNNDKIILNMKLDLFNNIFNKLEEVKMNYYAYKKENVVRMAINRTDMDYFKLVIGENYLSKIKFSESKKEYVPPYKNIFGNKEFRFIPNRYFLSGSTDFMLAVAKEIKTNNITFSGRVYDDHTTLTISHSDLEKVLEIQKNVISKRQTRIEINKEDVLAGAEIYKNIKDRVYIFYPEIDSETFNRIQPQLNNSGVLYSAVKLHDKGIIFAFDNNNSYEFNRILQQEINQQGLFKADLLNKAINLINDYCEKEFESKANFSNLNHVDLAYTTDEETEKPIEVYADLETFRLIKKYDGKIVNEEFFDSLNDMNKALEYLDFDELVSLSDDEKVKNEANINLTTFENQDFSKNTLPTITCEWSESNAFEDGKTYSVFEFDTLMKQADEEHIAGKKAAIKHYGSEKEWYNANDKNEFTQFYGYDKVKFTVNMPDGTKYTERQDIGDGYGGVIDFLSHYSIYNNIVPKLKNAKEIQAQKQSGSIEPPVIADFRARTEENFKFYNYKPVEIEKIAKDFVQNIFEENGVTAEIHGTAVTGSRSRGLENADSDIDVVMEIDSDLKEDALFNIIHDKELELEGYTIDINPIKADETGTLETYLPTAEAYLSEKSQNKKLFNLDTAGKKEPEKEFTKEEPVASKRVEIENHEQKYQQLSLFGEPAPTQTFTPVESNEPVANVNHFEELHKEIMRGSGFEDGKFRIAEFFQERNPNNKEFADFLKNEYGTGGHSADGNIFFVDHDSKGIQFTLRSTDGGINNEKFNFSWTEVAKLTADLIKHDKYITQDDIERRNQREAVREKSNSETADKSQNFTITDDKLGEGGAKAKFNANIEAIRILKKIEKDNLLLAANMFKPRLATPQEQKIISKYVGWGGLASAFDEQNINWSTEYNKLKELLTDDEYESARASTLDSFYTSPVIIDSIYSALEKFNFKGGNVLEPAMGVGNFFGRMPNEMQTNSNLYGFELDSLSGRIAKLLYPNANIHINGFEKNNFSDEYFDVAIGNVPFGNLPFVDHKHNTRKLHDYFFAETLDKVKPGGIVAFITSTGTLDKKDTNFRKQLSQQADLIGAIRLPNNAFKSNAGTEVTSDIIFLQKRSEPPQSELEWVHLGQTADGLPINKYFEKNPKMILGKIVKGNKLYGRGNDTMCVPIEGADLKEQLSNAIINLNATISTEKTNSSTLESTISVDTSDLKNYSYYVNENKEICFKFNEFSSEVWSKNGSRNAHKRAVDFIALRDCTRAVLTAQENNCSDEELQHLQNKLNSLYDSFYKKYGLLHSRSNKSYFSNDVSYPLVCSLESKIEKNKLIEKSALFTKRTIKPAEPVTHVDTAHEALIMSIAEKASVDFDYMSELSDLSKENLISQLKDEIYPVPELSNNENIFYQEASEYLSGDIRKKLDTATKAAEDNPIFEQNIAALTNVMPKPLKAGDISVKLGAMWIDPKYYQQFMYEIFKTADTYRADKSTFSLWKKSQITLEYSDYTNSWNIKNKNVDSSVTVNKTFGTSKRNAYKIFEDALNLKDPKVYKTVFVNGEEKRVVDYEATKLAQRKAEKIRETFKNWIFKDPDRRAELVEKYNRTYNSIRPREYDGSHLSFKGMNSEIILHAHQKNAIAHALYGGNTLFAHSVGAGKTYEMIATAMESKRLGLCSKSMFAVPNYLTEQIGDDFMTLYPNANILVATKNDFKKENRQKLVSKIATGNFDAVIIGHTQLSMIPISKERQEKQLRNQINDIINGIAKLKREDGEKYQVKAMERTKKSLQKQLDKLKKSNQDDIVTFEQLGVDKLFIDEAHEFKNLFCPTKLQNVAGISSSASQRALDLFMKCQYLDEKTSGKGIVFATGTPISNSVTELHTMMRFLQYDMLKEKQLNHFDNWVSVFGEQKTEYELSPAGNSYRPRTRIANYSNLPELMNMFKQCADIKTADTLDLDTPECELHIVNAEPTEFQQQLVSELAARADDVQNNAVDPTVDNMLKITSDGRKVGLDPRLIDPSFEDNPASKLNQCINNVFKIYEDTTQKKLTQIIFCDLGVPHKDSVIVDNNNANQSVSDTDSLEEESDFCVYDDIKSKLIAKGVHENEIAFIHSAKTEKAKSELFEKVRNGSVRVLIGSTGKLGMGTNVQDRLIATHDLDIPWRPADLEQRKGRVVRQGNINKKVHLYRYVTKGTFDAYSYQLLESKQKFISQIITSKSPARTCEDVDQQALSYSEIKALCTGDERIKELMVLENEVKCLNLEYQEWQNTKYEMEDFLKKYPEQSSYFENLLHNIKQDIEVCKRLPIDKETNLPIFKIKLNNTVYTDKTEAAKALEKACKESLTSDQPIEIGNIHGFPINISYSHANMCLVATLKGAALHKVNLGDSFPHNLKKIENLIFTMENRLDKINLQYEKLKADAQDAKSLLDEPFSKETELSQKSERLRVLKNELNRETANKIKNKSSAQNRTFYFEKARLRKDMNKGQSSFKDIHKTINNMCL